MSKLLLAKTGAEIIKRWAIPKISRANLAVTYLCNQQCKSCNIWKFYQNDNGKLSEEITAGEVHRILKNNKLMWISITGGEPFLKDDIVEILRICAKRLSIVSTITNGAKPQVAEKAVWKALEIGESLITFNVSLEGNKQLHDEFTRTEGSWELAMETLDRLKRIRNDRLKLGIEKIITNKMPNESIEQVRFLAKMLGVGLTFAFEQNSPFYGNENNHIGELEAPINSKDSSIISFLNSIFLQRNKVGKRACVAGEYSCFIDPYGVVCPCLFYTPTKPLVNLRETGYKIGKLDCKELRKSCSGCWTPCETYATMMFRPWRL